MIEWYRRGGPEVDHVGTVVKWLKKEARVCLVSFDETGSSGSAKSGSGFDLGIA
jgi:hypothetical protein